MSINFHVNMSVNVAAAAQARANFGSGLFVTEHTVTANRQDGPFSSLTALSDGGFTVSAAPAANAWAARFFAQNPRGSQIRIGRRASGEALYTALDAIEAVGPSNWYLTASELNTPNELLALATWTESRSKIALAQSSSAAMLAGTASTAQVSTFTVGGVEADGDYSIEVVNAWSGTSLGTATVTRAAAVPATNADIATAMRLAWDAVPALAAISAPAAGAAEDVEIAFDGLGNGYTFLITTPGGATLVESTPAFTQNPAELGAAAGFNRTALIYHDDDTEYLDAAWAARCLGFNLDAPGGAGVWAYHRFAGITPTSLSEPEKTNILGYPANYYAPLTFTSGVEDPGFVFPGQMLSGRFMDVQTSVDLTQARMEEALLAVLTAAAATSRPKVPYTDSGVARFREAALGVLNRLVRAGHFNDQATSSGTGRVTPYVDAPLVSEVSTADRSARRLTMSAEAVFSGAIQSVGDAATVGFTIDLSF